MSNQNKANGVVDQADVNDWISRFNAAVADSTIITAPAVDNAQPWHSPFFGCLTPINTCAITCCVPCVTFGKTHHRSRKDAKLQGYSCINATCLMFLGFTCFGLPWIPMMFQRADIRKKYQLQGDYVTDLFFACCCGCCSLVQQDKEVEHREGLLEEGATEVGYQPTEEMSYKK